MFKENPTTVCDFATCLHEIGLQQHEDEKIEQIIIKRRSGSSEHSAHIITILLADGKWEKYVFYDDAPPKERS